jgi:hypothetical protein
MSARPLLGAAIALFLAALGAQAAHACSICLSGDPTLANLGVQATHKGEWRITIENRSHSKANALENLPSSTEFEHENRVMFMASYAPTDRLMLGVNVPYLDRRHIEYEETARIYTKASNFGDVELQARYELLQSRALTRYISTAGLLGVVTPTGAADVKTADGERLDEHIQPGSGAWAGIAGLAELVQLSNRWLYTSAVFRLPGKNKFGYKYGNSLLLTMQLGQRVSRHFDVTAGLAGRSTGRDIQGEGENADVFQPESGGQIAFFTPGIQVRPVPQVAFRAEAYLPIWNHLEGTQHEDPNLLFAVTYARTK